MGPKDGNPDFKTPCGGFWPRTWQRAPNPSPQHLQPIVFYLITTYVVAVGMLTTNTNMNLVEQKGCFENFLVISWLTSKVTIS